MRASCNSQRDPKRWRDSLWASEGRRIRGNVLPVTTTIESELTWGNGIQLAETHSVNSTLRRGPTQPILPRNMSFLKIAGRRSPSRVEGHVFGIFTFLYARRKGLGPHHHTGSDLRAQFGAFKVGHEERRPHPIRDPELMIQGFKPLSEDSQGSGIYTP